MATENTDKRFLNNDLVDQLRKMSWNGIPKLLRGTTWRLLSGYLPPSIDRRQETLERKQAEYHNFVTQYYPTRHDPLHQETYRQVFQLHMNSISFM